ncbi:MAG: PAS domain-containing protein [Emcibacteraceae bacterium]|nr:PAS domain-containing protein [Emcibacteraceae bacterium]
MNDDAKLFTQITDDIFTAPYQRELYKYWFDLKKQRSMPARADIKVENFKSFLPNLMVIDVFNKGKEFKVRLFGTKCVSIYGELTGKIMNNFGEFDGATTRLLLGVQDKKPYYVIKNLNNIHKNYINTSFIVLPLSKDGETVNQFLVAHHFY